MIIIFNLFESYKVYDVVANSTFEKNVLLHLSSKDNYDFFIMPRKLGKAARVMIRPEDQLNFEDLLTEFGINFNVINHNIGKQLIIDRRSNYQLQKANNYDFKTIDLTQRHIKNRLKNVKILIKFIMNKIWLNFKL